MNEGQPQSETTSEPQPIIDVEAIRSYLARVVTQYEQTAPTVSVWADELYIKMNEDRAHVSVRELLTAQFLFTDGAWHSPNIAANVVYKLQYDMGQDTAGHAGF